MNGIQKYLIAVAVNAVRDAAGTMVADGEPDSVLVVQSLEELVQEMKNLDARVVSKVSCDLKYKGYETTTSPSGLNVVKPFFV